MPEERSSTIATAELLLEILREHGEDYGITKVSQLRYSSMLFVDVRGVEFSVTIGD